MSTATRDGAPDNTEPERDVSRRAFLSALSSSAALALGASAAATGGCSPAAPIGADHAGQKPSDLTRATVTELADLVRRKVVSSAELVDACLARIEAVNPKLNAVVKLAADEARAAARAADQALAQGKALGPLHGVPMTIKDSLDTAGIVTTGGTSGRKGFVPKEDATVVKRLKAAGAVLLGKTNTPELTWAFETNNPVYGRTNNPWDPKLSPGGSSGGAAAIVAACGAPFDVGSDTGGSVRVPSHFCGIAGLKPTSGRVPRTGHIVPAEGLVQAFTTLGPLARAVDDLWLLFGVIAGPDFRDAAIVPAPLGDPLSVRLKDLRLAVHTDNGICKAQPDLVKAVTAAAKALESAGAHVDEKKPDALTDVMQMDDDLYGADGGASLQRMLDRAGTKTPGPDLTSSLQHKPMTSAELTAAIERWDAWRGRMLGFLADTDAIVCPPCAFATLPHGASAADDAYSAFSYTFAYNMTGWPGAVVRAGTTAQGTPVGVQIVGRPFREDVVIALAREIERALGGYQAPKI